MATEQPSRLRTLLLVAGVSLGAALMITGTWEISYDRILENERNRLMANLSSVIDVPENAQIDALEIPAQQLPESEHVLQLFAMHADSQLIAWVYSGVAPNGYNGPIEFLAGITPAGEIIRIRIMQHRETPGLGDGIEAGKSNWLMQFAGRSAQNTAQWSLAADGGEFDSITGATVTPRAVVAAIGAVAQYHSMNSPAVRPELPNEQ